MFKAMDKWLLPYLTHQAHRYWHRIGRQASTGGPVHVMLAVCDHFEPLAPGGRQPHSLGLQRVSRWAEQYPPMARAFTDSDGCHPQHTLFYPEEEYHEEFMNPLANLTRDRLAEVEMHLHHRHDTPSGLLEKLTRFRDLLRTKHGLLGQANNAGQEKGSDLPRFGFIHGNWALCNSRPDGDWCGVNEELTVLAQAGCYADFTYPSAPSPTQPRMVNRIYYARDRADAPRGADFGTAAQVGTSAADQSGVLLVTGPLALDWQHRKWRVLPRLENSDLRANQPPDAARADAWIRQHIHVQGRPEWCFVKLHTHGCIEGNTDILLGPPMQRLHEYLTTRYNDRRHYCLHYVTAREMVNIIHAAEDGHTGNPGQYRDYQIAPPPLRLRR